MHKIKEYMAANGMSHTELAYRLAKSFKMDNTKKGFSLLDFCSKKLPTRITPYGEASLDSDTFIDLFAGIG